MIIEHPILVVPFTEVQDLYDGQIRRAIVRDYSAEELKKCYIDEAHLLSRCGDLETEWVKGEQVQVIPEYRGPAVKAIKGKPVQIRVLGIVYPTVSAVVEEVTAAQARDGNLYIAWDAII